MKYFLCHSVRKPQSMLALKGKHDYKNHPIQFFLIKKEGDNSIFNTNQQMYVFHALIPRLHFST